MFNVNNIYIIILTVLLVIMILVLIKWRKRAIFITHSGIYHLDEVFSTAVLILKLDGKKWFQVIRTRDEKIFEKWRKKRDQGMKDVYIYDVGRKYEEDKNEFDHHQIGGAGSRKNGIEYSSAGLVWKKYGRTLSKTERGFNVIDKEFVSAIDALDNGQEIYDKKYDIELFDLSDLIKLFSPRKKTDFRVKIAFFRSVFLIKYILEKKIKREIKNEKDIKRLKEIYSESEDKRFLIIEEKGLSISLVTEIFPELLFVIKKQKEDVWYIQTVRVKKDEFLRRKYLPESWGGYEGYELDQKTGILGGIFCHRALFIASAKTKEVAIEMVKIAINK